MTHLSNQLPSLLDYTNLGFCLDPMAQIIFFFLFIHFILTYIFYYVLLTHPNVRQLSLLDDGSPTSANLGNDHGFISEEY